MGKGVEEGGRGMGDGRKGLEKGGGAWKWVGSQIQILFTFLHVHCYEFLHSATFVSQMCTYIYACGS